MKKKTLGVLLASVLLPLTAGAWESGDLRLRGRLQTRFEVDLEQESSAFCIRRARFDGRWKPSDRVRLVLEFEGAGLLETRYDESAYTELKDAYGRIDVHEALRVQVGYFKKPFSRLKMMSAFGLFLPVRGMLNRYAVARTGHGGYGGRDVGLMLSGRFNRAARLRYFIGAFSGLGFQDGLEESHKDVVGRLQVRPHKGLRVAVNATHKLYHDLVGKTHTVNLFGADLRYQLGDLTLMLEGAYGDNVDAGPDHLLWGFHGTIAYALSLSDTLVLTPAVMLEVFDPDDRIDDGRAIRIAGALNLDIFEICRVILFAEGTVGDLRAYDRTAVAARVRQVPTRIFVQVNMAF
jgi:hypothetical protein